MLNFFKTAKIKNRFKNTPNPFVYLEQNAEKLKPIYYDETDGLDTWVDGIIKTSNEFSILSADLLCQAYKPTDMALQFPLLAREFHLLQTNLLGRFRIFHDGFEKKVWLSVWESIGKSYISVFYETLDMVTSAMPDDEIKEKMMKMKPPDLYEPYEDYMVSSDNLCKGEIKNTPIEVLQNKLLKYYNYPPKKEAELKELIKKISFSALNELISIYCWDEKL